MKQFTLRGDFLLASEADEFGGQRLIASHSLAIPTSKSLRRAMPSAVFVGASAGKLAPYQNVSAVGFDPLVVQFALGN